MSSASSRSRSGKLCFTIFVVFAWACNCVHAADSVLPLLRINDPFSASIWRIDGDDAERHIASSSADEAVTIWSLDAVNKPTIHRVPPRAREQQRAHAVAISPDGSITAYSVVPLRDAQGWPVPDTSSIFVLDTYNGKIIHEIKDIPNRPQDLLFSPDGHYLAAAISDGCGVRVWTTHDWELFGSDDVGYGGDRDEDGSACKTAVPEERDALPDTLSLAFSEQTDVWLVTSGDTGIRTYRKTGSGIERILHRRPVEIGVAKPDGIAISPDGTKLAVGDQRLRDKVDRVSLRIVILNLSTLEPQGESLEVFDRHLAFPDYLDPETNPAAHQFNLSKIAWDKIGDSEWLIAGGAFACVLARRELRVGELEHGWRELCVVGWKLDPAGTVIRFFPFGSDQAMDLEILPRRQWIVIASRDRIVALDTKGNPQPIGTSGNFRENSGTATKFDFRNRAADFRDRSGPHGSSFAFLVSDDAKTVYFEDYRSKSKSPIKLRFDLVRLGLEFEGKPPVGLHPPDQDELLIESYRSWRNSPRSPQVYGHSLPLPGDGPDIYRAVALLPGKQAVILSANFIRIVDYRQKYPRIRCQRRIAAEGYRVNVTPDGAIAVVGHGDGTLRWYRIVSAEGGNCLLHAVLSVHLREVEGSRGDWVWIAWRPDTGEFAMDPRAEGLVVWQLADSRCNTRVVPFGELTLDFYDRRAVQSALDEPQDSSAMNRRLMQAVNAFCDPIVIRIDTPNKKARTETEMVRFRLHLSGETTWPRELFVTLGDSIRVVRYRAERRYGPEEPLVINGPGILQLDVELPVTARERRGDFHLCFHLHPSRHCHPLVWSGPLWKPDKRRLWAILVGISKYGTGRRSHQLDLPYAQNDVLDVAKLFIGDFQRRIKANRQEQMQRVAQYNASVKRAKTENLMASIDLDYDEIHLVLIVAPTLRSDAEYELKELGTLRYVEVQPPSLERLRQTLTRTVERMRIGASRHDLFLFYFSGHGLASPVGESKGHSLFLLPMAGGEITLESLVLNAFRSSELLDALSQVTAEPFVIFDACRDVVLDPSATPFDPGKIRSEFEHRVPNAHFFFSADAGQRSLDQNRLVFDQTRRKRFRGNGLFTYAVLKSLTDPEADFPMQIYAPGKIQVEEVSAYVDVFFASQTEVDVEQVPVFVPARTGTKTVVRSLDRVTNR